MPTTTARARVTAAAPYTEAHLAAREVARIAKERAKAAVGTDLFDALMAEYRVAGAALRPHIDEHYARQCAMAVQL